MGKVIMSGIVPQLTKPSAGTPISAFAVGSTVKMNVNGTATDFLIVHQGLPSGMYDDSCNGTWLLMKDIYESRAWQSSDSNSYNASTIHSYLNSTFLNLFDANIRKHIKTVKIPYVNGTVSSGANGLSAQIFLLSGYEVGFTQSLHPYIPIDGEKLEYFVSGNDSTANAKRIANLNGKATIWWLRSPNTYNTSDGWFVRDDGDCGGTKCYNSEGIRPALVLPSTTKVADDGSVIV